MGKPIPMSVALIFPDINPFRPAQADLPFPDKWGYPAYGTALHMDSLQAGLVKEPWYKPVLRSQPICFQYHRGRTGNNSAGTNPTELYILDEDDNLLKYINPTSSYIAPGIKHPATGEQLYTEQFQFTISQFAELNGYRFIKFKLRCYYDDGGAGTVKDYNFDPLVVDDKFKGYSTFEYSNDTNDFWILFEQLRPHFCMLVPSKGMFMEVGGRFISMTEQSENVEKLNGKSNRKYEWDIGGYVGIVQHEYFIIDEGLNCDNIRIDNGEYARVKKDFIQIGPKDKHIRFRRIELTDKRDVLEFTDSVIEFYTRPGTYPYAISHFVATDGYTYFGTQVKVFDDAAAETAFIASMNAQAANNGASGEFQLIGDKICMINANGQRFFPQAAPIKVFSKVFTLTVQVYNAGTAFDYNLTFPNTNLWHHVVCWHATAGDEQLVVAGGVGGTTVNVSKVFTTTGTKTVRIFHRDDAIEFMTRKDVPGPTVPGVTAVTGNVPASLKVWRLIAHPLTSGIHSLSYLTRAKDSLTTLIITNSLITGISNWATALVSGSYKPYALLNYFYFFGNALTSAAVDSMLEEYFLDTAWSSGPGTIVMKNNFPPAPPVAPASATYISVLSSAGKSILTD
jgi:hypothetical protein